MAEKLCWSEMLCQQLFELKRTLRRKITELENKFREDREKLIKNAVEGVRGKCLLIINKNSRLHGEKVNITGFSKPFTSDLDPCSIALIVSRRETRALESRMTSIIIPGTELHLIDIEEDKKEEKTINAAQELSTLVFRPPTEFIYDQRQEGCELLENVALEKSEISLELDDLSFCDGMIGDGNIFGPTLLKYAKKMNSAGQLHAERLLFSQSINQLFNIRQNQREEIPQEWQNFELIFPGTVWRASDGNLLIPTLKWICTKDWRWNLVFYSFRYNFSANTRMVCIHKQS